MVISILWLYFKSYQFRHYFYGHISGAIGALILRAADEFILLVGAIVSSAMAALLLRNGNGIISSCSVEFILYAEDKIIVRATAIVLSGIDGDSRQ